MTDPTTALARLEEHRHHGLAVAGLQVRYGGHIAVHESNLAAPPGQITGLIGPNGAGKTTTFNACSGFVRPTSGRVYLDGRDITRLGPAARARRGLGRTYQRMELFDSLTVADNVGLGLESYLAGRSPLRQIFATLGERRRIREVADDAMQRCGITHLAGRRPSELSTGQRRLVELARAIAGPFRTLLLDEPSSGLDVSETHQFGEVLRELVADGTTGILLVEHDMALVMSITDYCYVLDFGKLIFEGTPQQVAASEVVRASYLGSEADAHAAGLDALEVG